MQNSHRDSVFGIDAKEGRSIALILEQLRVLGSEREQEFDRITSLACAIFQVPMAAIGFLDGERFRFKAKQGIEVDEVDAANSLCLRCLKSDAACVVTDTLADPDIVRPHQVAGDAQLRFYAGVPLAGRKQRIGTLCLMDVVPRPFSAEQLLLLQELGRMVEDLLELRLARLELRDEMGRQHQVSSLLRAIIDHEPECVKVVEADGRLRDMNPAGLQMIEAATLEAVCNQPVDQLVHPEDRKAYVDLHTAALNGTAGRQEFRIIGLAGTERWMESKAVPLPNADGKVDAVLSVTRDISQLRRESALHSLEARVLDFISANATLQQILSEITHAVDGMLPDFRSSILLVEGPSLRHGAAPNMPHDFNAAIDGIPVAEGMGGCGTAAFRGKPVIVHDVANDPLFEPFRALAQEFRIGACWSAPVLDTEGKVLATFALYADHPRRPELQHFELINRISQFVRIAIERKGQYQRLLQSEARYRSLFDLVPVAIWEEDWSELLPRLAPLRAFAGNELRAQIEGFPQLFELAAQTVKIRSVNQAALEIFEADSQQQLIGSLGTVFDTPDVLPGFKAQLAALLEGETQHHSEFRLRTVNGRLIQVLAHVAFHEPHLDTGRVTLCVMDITARKEAEQRFRVVAQTTSDVVWDWTMRTNRIWWNSGMQTSFGYREDQIDGSPEFWRQRVHPDERARVVASVKSALAGGDERWREEYRFQLANGSYAWIADQGAIIRDEQGKVVRMIGSMVDISEQRLLQEQLRQSQRLDAIGQLTGGVAHDFNNLLTVILGNAETLAESLTDDQRLRMLADVTAKAAERAAELTSRLLAFARRQPLEPRAADINKLIAQMDSLLRRSLGEHVEIELVRGGGLWKAMVDPGQLENALLNLCINARDAMPQGGRLTIETANTFLDAEYVKQHSDLSPGRYVMIGVSDTGTGMDKETLQKAFEPFFTTKEVGKGSGLGLSMVYGFIKQSFGHVRIYSENGEGTTIRLYLPRAEKDEEEVSEPVQTEPDRGSERILLVEDDDMVREHIHALLLQLGYHVVPACNGREALQVLDQKGPFDLLFTDVVMPGGISGRQLADMVRERHPDMPVLYTSGYTENAIVHHGRLDNGVVLLQKPFRRQELAEKVRLVLGERST